MEFDFMAAVRLGPMLTLAFLAFRLIAAFELVFRLIAAFDRLIAVLPFDFSAAARLAARFGLLRTANERWLRKAGRAAKCGVGLPAK
jgi:hypothetical protein